MANVLTFKVGIEGLEDKIWRKIEITDRRTVADLAYTILATFDSLAYHLYNIKYKNYIFDCWVCAEESPDYDDLTNKPTIPAAQVNSDWNASSGVAQILNKPQTEQWEFTVDDGQGGTTTVIKNIYVG